MVLSTSMYVSTASFLSRFLCDRCREHLDSILRIACRMTHAQACNEMIMLLSMTGICHHVHIICHIVYHGLERHNAWAKRRECCCLNESCRVSRHIFSFKIVLSLICQGCGKQ